MSGTPAAIEFALRADSHHRVKKEEAVLIRIDCGWSSSRREMPMR